MQSKSMRQTWTTQKILLHLPVMQHPLLASLPHNPPPHHHHHHHVHHLIPTTATPTPSFTPWSTPPQPAPTLAKPAPSLPISETPKDPGPQQHLHPNTRNRSRALSNTVFQTMIRSAGVGASATAAATSSTTSASSSAAPRTPHEADINDDSSSQLVVYTPTVFELCLPNSTCTASTNSIV